RAFDHLLVGNQRDNRYWQKFEDLASDIKETLRLIRDGDLLSQSLSDASQSAETSSPESTPAQVSVVSSTPSATVGRTVYLAETASDLRSERDNIKRELQQHGHRVLPANELPLEISALTRAVNDNLQNAALSIHLIGKSYGIVPENEER